MSTYTEDHLVEQPAIQLMQHELGWDVVNCYDEWNGGVSNQGRDGKREGGNIERRTPNIEHRSEEKLKRQTSPALQRLNPDLPVEAIEGAVEEMGILSVGSVVAFGYAGTSSGVAGGYAGTGSWILNGRGRRQAVPRLNPSEFGRGGAVSALVDGFQCFGRFHRLVKLAFSLKPHSISTESGVSRMRESGDFVKTRPPSACALPRFGAAGNFTVENQTFPHSPLAAVEFDFEDFSHKPPFSPKRENAHFSENLTNFHDMRRFHQSVK